MNPVIPVEAALRIATKLVWGRFKHEDYTHTVELADTLRRLITGKDMAPLYVRYDPRESEEALKQAIRITNPITPSITNALSTPVLKLATRSPKMDIIQYEGDKEEKRSKELRDIVDSFNGGNDLDSYFGENLLPYGLQDPNAFCLLTFENYDSRYEKPKVFGSIQPAKDVWGFEYHGNTLQWLFLHKTIEYEVGGEVITSQLQPRPKAKQEGDRFILYTGDHHIVFTQIDRTTVPEYLEGVIVDINNVPIETPSVSTADALQTYYFNAKAHVYHVHVYEQLSGQVPAFRLGTHKDPFTYGRTCVNLWNAAMPYLLKNVKSVREMDLSFVLHTFLQRISYAPRCTAEGCTGGYLPMGDSCTVCKGTGKLTFSTAQDHIELSLPVQRDPSALIDLEKLVYYVTLPTDILKIQMDNVQGQIQGAFKAVYNSDIFVTDTTADTATGKKIDMQSVYDAIAPAAAWYSDVRMKMVEVIATYMDMDKGLVVVHSFPHDLHYESQDQILERISKGKGIVTNGLLQHWQDELIDVSLYDDPLGAARVKTMTRFDPFVGKSDDAVMTIISQGLTTERNKILWANMPYVFDQAEASVTDTGKTFYELSHTEQAKRIDAIVQTIITQKAEDTPEPIVLGAEDDEQDESNRSSSDLDDGQGATQPVPGDREDA